MVAGRVEVIVLCRDAARIRRPPTASTRADVVRWLRTRR